MFIASVDEWAHAHFAPCQLGDQRRTRRLISYAADQARHAEASTAAATEGDAARLQGAYRLLHNEHVQPDRIAEGAYHYALTRAAGDVAQQSTTELLALEDTTSLSYSHAVRSQRDDLGGHFTAHTARGFLAHSVLPADAASGALYGLVEQFRWQRPAAKRGHKHQRRKRPYEEKESYKWEAASRRLQTRLAEHDLLERTIWVCDREADIYEYLQYKWQSAERFLVRAAQDRLLNLPTGEKLRDHLCRQAELGRLMVQVGQHQGRPARVAELVVRCAQVTLMPTSRRGSGQQRSLQPVPLHVIWVREQGAPKRQKPLDWMLLTSEPIETREQVCQLVTYYSRRWLIEEFHRSWKSGCRVEERRLQSAQGWSAWP